MNKVKARDEVRTNEEYADIIKALSKIQGTDEISEVINELSNKMGSAVKTMEGVGKIVLDQINSVCEAESKKQKLFLNLNISSHRDVSLGRFLRLYTK